MRRSIAPVLEGARLEKVEIRDPRLVRPFDPLIVANALVGERVGEVGRRGKYLIVGFESGRSLLIHLRMTGSLRHARSGALADDPYTRAVLRLDNGSDVGYRDVRRFGTWELFEQDELAPYLAARLGPSRSDRSRRHGSASASRAGVRRSSRRFSISGRSQASGTSTSTRRSGRAGCIRYGLRAASTRESSAACTAR